MRAFLSVFLALSAAQAEDPAAEAQALLEKAENQAREAHYEDARATYAKAARKYPDTEAGKTAARRSLPSAFLGFTDVVRQGPSINRIDVVLMGDGYTLGHQDAFDDLAADIPQLFERQKTFREYWSYFNFLRANLVSADDGVDGFGRHYDTALDARTLATDAGHVGVDRGKVRQMLSEMPEDDGFAIVFVKLGVLGTGGGGVAVIGGMDASTTIHEWGHAFGGLSDEYDQQLSKHTPAPKDGINVSASEDPKAVPWAHWIAARHPSVGVYEGAAQRVRGAWRPTASGCVMQSGEFFCQVCEEALVLKIYSIVDPIESESPSPPPSGIREPIVLRDEPVEFTVRVMKPETHDLEVRWWAIHESRLPETHGGPRDRPRPPTPLGSPEGKQGTGISAQPAADMARKGARVDRSERGPLQPIPDRPIVTTRTDADGVHVLRLGRTDVEPGRYKIVCRVKDTTLLRDEKWPMVLKDARGLLESERTWWLSVPERR